MICIVMAFLIQPATAVDFESYMTKNVDHPALNQKSKLDQSAFQEVPRQPAATESEPSKDKPAPGTPQPDPSKGSELN